VSLAPADAVARARYARAQIATGDDRGARAEIERLLAMKPLAPHVQASMYAEYAGILERSGDRPRAIEFYQRARDTRGGALDVRRAAERARARLAD